MGKSPTECYYLEKLRDRSLKKALVTEKGRAVACWLMQNEPLMVIHWVGCGIGR
jgi:hypothetical protein